MPRIRTSIVVSRKVCANPTLPSCCDAATQPFLAANTSPCSPNLTVYGNLNTVFVAIVCGNTGQENTKQCPYSGPPLVVHTCSHTDQLQFETLLGARMVGRRCAHCCQAGVCVHHVTAGLDVNTCNNGGNLNLATVIGCALETEKKRVMAVLTPSAHRLT
jgi:hypothetical protein